MQDITPKPAPMPQYHPMQLQQPQLQQQSQPTQQPQTFLPQYGQFPSTYPYNTINHQFFTDQNFTTNMQQGQPATVNPSAGMYAPIPFVGQTQSIRPGMQNTIDLTTNGGYHPQLLSQPQQQRQIAVDIAQQISREGIYIDDTRNVKRVKIEPKRTLPSRLEN